MKTRRSPENQDRLFKYLTPPKSDPPAVNKLLRCFDCANYPKGGRSRGHCTLWGEVVRGVEVKTCLKERVK